MIFLSTDILLLDCSRLSCGAIRRPVIEKTLLEELFNVFRREFGDDSVGDEQPFVLFVIPNDGFDTRGVMRFDLSTDVSQVRRENSEFLNRSSISCFEIGTDSNVISLWIRTRDRRHADEVVCLWSRKRFSTTSHEDEEDGVDDDEEPEVFIFVFDPETSERNEESEKGA